jgi:enoyl-CoA hydratase
MDEKLLVIERPQAGCTQITLNRPEVRNALSRSLRRELTSVIDDLNGRDEARVLILTGAGDAFCAGLDLKELGASTSTDVLGFEDRALNPVAALQSFAGPVIGAINGPAITGGFELALACDVLLCSTNARFADTHVRVGIMPTWGLSQRLSRVIGVYRARELSLTGNFLSAQRAEAWGLVNRVVAPEHLATDSRELASQMLSAIPHMLVSYKRLINDGFAMPLGEAIALESERGLAAARSMDITSMARRRNEVIARGARAMKSE